VWIVSGDGDALSIGGNHLVHALRRNVPVKILLFNNRIYGLTKGQASPTSELGLKTKSTPMASKEASADQPVNPLALAIISGATWVARGFSGKPKDLTELLKQAIQHEGYAFLQVISPCVTFHDLYETAKAGQKPLEPEHDKSDKFAAMRAAMTEHWATGVFYEEKRENFGAAIQKQIEAAKPRAGTGLAALMQRIKA
jgi:2-oxoglutarate/2-oxoacid ferredoxin oxidoreductase subunit beta